MSQTRFPQSIEELYASGNQNGSPAMVEYELPLNEVAFDFYARLTSVSKRLAPFDYRPTDYKAIDLARMQIRSTKNGDALAMLVHSARAEGRSRRCSRR